MANDRPKLGILGGMGPQATLELCQRIVDYTAADRDQDHIPTLIYNDTWIPDRTGRFWAAMPSGAMRPS